MEKEKAILKTSNIDHKNIELLRYYISRDINSIENELTHKNKDVTGYIIAGVIDLIIAILFDDIFSNICTLQKFVFFFVLLCLIPSISYVVNTFREFRKEKNAISGRDVNYPDQVMKVVDEFDNIATDGLLLCMYYKEKYFLENDEKLKKFYLFEAFHYLKKSCAVYRKIALNHDKYVKTQDEQLISKYRIVNYLEIANEMIEYINGHIDEAKDKELSKQVDNLLHDIREWKRFEL